MKKGDIVILKSGGPLMTIHHIRHSPYDEDVGCVWFVDGHLHSGDFTPETLTMGNNNEANLRPTLR